MSSQEARGAKGSREESVGNEAGEIARSLASHGERVSFLGLP